jgi:hypothetical protein
MYTNREQYEVLQNVRLKDGETSRVNCPFCGGKNTLTVSNLDGNIVWNCYKASCSAKGGKRVGRSLDNIKAKLANPNHKTVLKRRPTPLPAINSHPDQHEAVMEYLDDNNCIQAYEDSAISITYDPAKNRVLFWMNDGEGAVGRSLTSGTKPKWLSYGNTAGILAVGNSDTAIVVEDAASACSVYTTGIYTGVALLGTNLSSEQKHLLKSYSRIIICLDKDASSKAVRLSCRLKGIANVTVRFLEHDLKYLRGDQIKELVNEGPRNSSN